MQFASDSSKGPPDPLGKRPSVRHAVFIVSAFRNTAGKRNACINFSVPFGPPFEDLCPIWVNPILLLGSWSGG